MDHDANRQFQDAFANSPVGMVFLTQSGRIEYANQAFVQLSGEQSEELTGAHLQHLIANEDVNRLQAALRALRADPSGKRRLTVRRTDSRNRKRWWKIALASGSVSSGGERLLCGLIDDVSEQKQAEMRLKHERDTAEKNTKTKSAFLANMSHEIRTPLHTITGITELLLDTSLDAEQREYGEQIRFSAEVLLGLINDILDFSKIEAGKLTLEVIQFDLLTMTEDAVDMVSLEAHKKGLEVVTFLDPRLPQAVSGDPVRLRQIIVNLFNNAVKFTSKGFICIRVRPVLGEDGGNLIHFEVIDSGIGIPEDKRERLFQAFSQMDSSTTRRFGGTGLGLSISKNLVEMMNGRIGVSSREGAGSRFWFRIPLDDAGADESRSAPLHPVGAGRRVLIIDDSRTAATVLGRYLRAWKAETVRVETGEQGIEALRAAALSGEPYDLALVDQDLPGMDGWQVASEVHADELIRDTALILLSPAGKSATEAKMKLLKWFSAYLNKPVKWRELYHTLYQVLEQRTAAASPQAEQLRLTTPGLSAQVEELELVEDEDAEELIEELEAADELGEAPGERGEPAVEHQPQPVASGPGTAGTAHGPLTVGDHAPQGEDAGDAGAGATAAGDARARDAAAGDTEAGEYRLLVAEDHPVNQQLFETILLKLGYAPTVATDGYEAVELARSGEFDLVFMDVQMPRLNGYEATRAIREFTRELPIIAVTANAIHEERERCLDAGMNDFLSKPFKSRDVVPVLRRWLPKHRDVAGVYDSSQETTVDGSRPASLETTAGAQATAGAESAEAVGQDELVFDLETATEAFMGKRDVVVRVVSRFRVQTEQELERLANAIAARDWEAVRLGAHSIKGGAQSLGAMPLGRAAARLEATGREEAEERAEDEFSRLREEYRRFVRRTDSMPELSGSA